MASWDLIPVIRQDSDYRTKQQTNQNEIFSGQSYIFAIFYKVL